MTTFDKYIKENNFPIDELTRKHQILFNEAIKAIEAFKSGKDKLQLHKNKSVMFLALSSMDSILANRFTLNTEVFDYKFVNEQMSQMLKEETGVECEHPFDYMF